MAVRVLLYISDPYFMGQFKLLLRSESHLLSAYSFSDLDAASAYLQDQGDSLQCILTDTKALAAPVGTASILLGEETVRDADGPMTLNIYQKKQDVMDDLKLLLRDIGLLSGRSAPASRTGGLKVVSFFSTQGGSGVSTLAYLAAIKGSETGKTVYLNLESAPCTDILYQQGGPVKAEEFLCDVKDHKDPLSTLPTALWRNAHGVFVFPTPVSLMDQRDLGEDDVRYLLEGLAKLGDVELVVVDLSTAFGSVCDYVMGASDRVVLVYDDNKTGQAKRDAFLNDPAFASFPCAGRAVVAGNRCRENVTGGAYAACFPYSDSLASSRDAKLVLRGNQAIAQGCEELLRF